MLARTNLLACLLCTTVSVPAWASDASECGPTYCDAHSICRTGLPQFGNDDLPGDIAGTIRWHSQVYGALDHAVASYCFFRAVKVSNPQKALLPIFWEPGGISYEAGSGDNTGCLAVCSAGSSETKPSTTPIEGHLYAGLVHPTSTEARSWGPSGGWSDIASSELKPIPKDPPPSRTEVITFDDKQGTPVVVSITSSMINSQTVLYNIANEGKSGVKLTLNMPVNASIRTLEGPFSGEAIILKEGSGYKNEVNVASQPNDNGATVNLTTSQVRIDLGDSSRFAVEILTFSASNGSYRIAPAAFMRSEKK